MAAVRSVAGAALALRVLAADDRLDQPEVAVAPAVEDRGPAPISASTKTKNWWPSSSIRATASSSNIGSIAKRFVLTIRRSRAGSDGAVGDPAEERLLLGRPGPDPRLLAVVDRPPLELVDDLVDAGPVGLGRRVRPQGPAVDHERDLDDVRVGGAPVLLDRELDERVAPVVEDPLEAGQLALGVRRGRGRGRRCSCP